VKIYRLVWQDGHDRVTLDGDTWDRVYPLFDGTKRASKWKPVRMKLVKARKAPTDFPFIGPHVPILSGRARAVVEPLVGSQAEFLPLAGLSPPYFALNVLNVLDALDVKRSKVELDADDGTIAFVKRYAFKPEIVDGQTIFKVKDWEVTFVFVSEAFKKAVEKAKLTGVLFQLEDEV